LLQSIERQSTKVESGLSASEFVGLKCMCAVVRPLSTAAIALPIGGELNRRGFRGASNSVAAIVAVAPKEPIKLHLDVELQLRRSMHAGSLQAKVGSMEGDWHQGTVWRQQSGSVGHQWLCTGNDRSERWNACT